MSEIKSHISLESLPENQSFITPHKNNKAQLQTNASVGLSQTLGTIDNFSIKNKSFVFRSNQLFKQPYSNDQGNVTQNQLQNNPSSMTLMPVVTQQDFYQLIQTMKMINFMVNQYESNRHYLNMKMKIIKKTSVDVAVVYERNQRRLKTYNSKLEEFKQKENQIKRKNKYMKETMVEKINDLKIEIRKMKRSLSNKRQNSERRYSNKRQERHYSHQKRFFPHQTPNNYMFNPYPKYPTHPQQFFQNTNAHNNRHHQNVNFQNKNFKDQLNFIAQKQTYNVPDNANRHEHNPIRFNINNHINHQLPAMNGVQSNSNRNIANNFNQVFTGNLNEQALKDGLKKLFQPHNELKDQKKTSNRQQTNKNHIRSSQQQPNQIKLDDNFINILSGAIQQKLNIQQPIDTKNNSAFPFRQNQLLASQKSQKSQKLNSSRKNNEENIQIETSKWKSDQDSKDDVQIIQLLQKSMHPRSQVKINIESEQQLNRPKERSQMGALLIQTNNNQDIFNFNLPENSRSNQQSKLSNSRINISLESEEKNQADKKQSRSKQEGKKIQKIQNTLKVPTIAQSNVNIFYQQEMSHSIDPESSCELSNDRNDRNKPASKLITVQQKISQIDQVSDDTLSRQTTPVDLKISSNMEPNHTPRTIIRSTAKQQKMTNSKDSEIAEIIVPQIKQNKKIDKQHYQQDFQQQDYMSSIKLSTESKISIQKNNSPFGSKIQNQTISALQEHPLIKQAMGQDQDYLSQIRLATISKDINNLQAAPQNHAKTGTQAQKKIKQTNSRYSNYQQKQKEIHKSQIIAEEEDCDQLSSDIRLSTNSKIVKKVDSPIKKTKPNSLGVDQQKSKKSSSGQSLLRISSMLSSLPIQQATQQEEQQSTIQRISARKTSY